MAKKPIVGISMGDFNGIGAEILIKSLNNSLILELCTPILFGSGKVLSYYKKNIDPNFIFNGIDNANQAIDAKINVVNCYRQAPVITPGKISKEGGDFAYHSLKAAVEALKNNKIDVLVTAPICKENIQNESFYFPGHTEYLAKELGGTDALMILLSESLKIATLTGHISLDKVSQTISAELLEKKINILEETLKHDFNISKPKIAVLGIDPHAGDNGVIGSIDNGIILPTVNKFNESGKLVFGPFPADAFFGRQEYKKFDAVMAMYHDQALIPFKTLFFDNGVNYTAGLSKIRTSPCHGTAFDIAGKAIAEESSMLSAIFSAIDIFRNRQMNKELIENKMQVSTKNIIAQQDEDIDLMGDF